MNFIEACEAADKGEKPYRIESGQHAPTKPCYLKKRLHGTIGLFEEGYPNSPKDFWLSDIKAEYEIREDPAKLIKELRDSAADKARLKCRNRLMSRAADYIERLINK